MKHRTPNLVPFRLRASLCAGLRSRSRQLAAGGALLLAVSMAAYSPASRSADGAVDAGPALAAAPDASPSGRAADAGTGVAAAKAEAAVAALSPRVARTSSEGALRTAFQAYFNYREAHAADVSKPYLYFVDLGLGNGTPRGWVFDMEALRVVEGPFNVAHGRGSGPRNGVPKRFSNAPGSYASSLGLYLAQETYTFTGKSGGRRYSSVGLRMRGESGEFNGAARPRGIVAHGAPYVTSREAGRSEGCPAMEPARADRLLPMIANGGVVFIYSPNDPRWLAGDPWLRPAETPVFPNIVERLSH